MHVPVIRGPHARVVVTNGVDAVFLVPDDVSVRPVVRVPGQDVIARLVAVVVVIELPQADLRGRVRVRAVVAVLPVIGQPRVGAQHRQVLAVVHLREVRLLVLFHD